jgi:DNA-binding CsgD family transcriptional regulator
MLMFTIRREQGRLEEMRPVLSLLARAEQASGVWAPGLALAAAELGFMEEARKAVSRTTTDGFAGIPRDSLWPAVLGLLSEAAVLLEDQGIAEPLLVELDAFAGEALMAGFTTTLGPADRLRAALSEQVGRSDDADRWISAARDLAVRAGSPTWLARVEHTHAWILARRGDEEGAGRHYEAAVVIAEPIGMRWIVDHPPLRVAAASPPAAPGSQLPDGLSVREVEVLALVAGGRSNREIAETLHISPNTAANHVRSILQKTACANRAEAAGYAVRRGLAHGG